MVKAQSEALGGSAGYAKNPRQRGAMFFFCIPFVNLDADDNIDPKPDETQLAGNISQITGLTLTLHLTLTLTLPLTLTLTLTSMVQKRYLPLTLALTLTLPNQVRSLDRVPCQKTYLPLPLTLTVFGRRDNASFLTQTKSWHISPHHPSRLAGPRTLALERDAFDMLFTAAG